MSSRIVRANNFKRMVEEAGFKNITQMCKKHGIQNVQMVKHWGTGMVMAPQEASMIWVDKVAEACGKTREHVLNAIEDAYMVRNGKRSARSGNIFFDRRVEKGLSQTELCKMIGIPQSTYTMFENRGTTMFTSDVAKRIREVLGITMEQYDEQIDKLRATRSVGKTNNVRNSSNFVETGNMFVDKRIKLGLSQRQLAEKLGGCTWWDIYVLEKEGHESGKMHDCVPKYLELLGIGFGQYRGQCIELQNDINKTCETEDLPIPEVPEVPEVKETKDEETFKASDFNRDIPVKIEVADGYNRVVYKSKPRIKTREQAINMIKLLIDKGRTREEISNELGLTIGTIDYIIDNFIDDNKENQSMRERFENRQAKKEEPKAKEVNKYKLSEEEIDDILGYCYGKLSYTKWKALKNGLNYYMKEA